MVILVQTKQAPYIILTSDFVYARPGQGKNYGSYGTDYMARKEALEKLSYLTPEEKTEYLQRKVLLSSEDDPNLVTISKHYSQTNDDSKLTKASIAELNKTSFIELSSQDYSKYIGYMMRKQALANKEKTNGLSATEAKELERVTKAANKYDASQIGKDKILQGYFSCDQDTIKLGDLDHIRAKMRSAQANNSILWQDVISFDNEYLRKMGVFDPTTGYLDESGIRKASKKMMDTLTEKENLNNPFWTAAIHRNTDNIHIHFGIVEAANSRPLKRWKDEDGIVHVEPKGWRQLSTIQAMKSAFTNEMFDITSLLKEMNLRRNEITKGMTEAFTKSFEEPNFQRDLNDFIQVLPEDRNKWRWANLNSEQRQTLTTLVDTVMEDNPSYQKWNNLFQDYREHYQKMYGQAKNNRDNEAAKKWEDLKRRAGNALLKEIKVIDQNVNHFRQQGTRAQSKANFDQGNVNNVRHRRRNKQFDWQELNFKRQKDYKRKKELENSLNKAIRPLLTRKASNVVFNRIKRQCEKNLTTLEKQQALSAYERTQQAISMEQERR